MAWWCCCFCCCCCFCRRQFFFRSVCVSLLAWWWFQFLQVSFKCWNYLFSFLLRLCRDVKNHVFFLSSFGCLIRRISASLSLTQSSFRYIYICIYFRFRLQVYNRRISITDAIIYRHVRRKSKCLKTLALYRMISFGMHPKNRNEL